MSDEELHLGARDLAMAEQFLDQDQPRARGLELAREAVPQAVRSDHLPQWASRLKSRPNRKQVTRWVTDAHLMNLMFPHGSRRRRISLFQDMQVHSQEPLLSA